MKRQPDRQIIVLDVNADKLADVIVDAENNDQFRHAFSRVVAFEPSPYTDFKRLEAGDYWQLKSEGRREKIAFLRFVHNKARRSGRDFFIRFEMSEFYASKFYLSAVVGVTKSRSSTPAAIPVSRLWDGFV